MAAMSSRGCGFMGCRNSFFLLKLFRCSALFFLLLVIPSATVVRAQVLYGTISGNVTDSSGALINGASVVALNTDTGVSRTVTTSAKRIDVIQDLQTGTYIITMTASSCRPDKLSVVQ